jgi:hypothetical protein
MKYDHAERYGTVKLMEPTKSQLSSELDDTNSRGKAQLLPQEISRTTESDGSRRGVKSIHKTS